MTEIVWKYQQIKGGELVRWKRELSVVDEPMEKEESETLAKKRKKNYSEKILLKEWVSDIYRSVKMMVNNIIKKKDYY